MKLKYVFLTDVGAGGGGAQQKSTNAGRTFVKNS